MKSTLLVILSAVAIATAAFTTTSCTTDSAGNSTFDPNNQQFVNAVNLVESIASKFADQWLSHLFMAQPAGAAKHEATVQSQSAKQYMAKAVREAHAKAPEIPLKEVRKAVKAKFEAKAKEKLGAGS